MKFGIFHLDKIDALTGHVYDSPQEAAAKIAEDLGLPANELSVARCDVTGRRLGSPVSQAEFDAAAREATALLKDNEGLELPFSVLVEARRLYGMAYREMQNILGGDIVPVDTQGNMRPANPLVLEVLMQSANEVAGQPFDITDHLGRMNEVMAWLKYVVERDTAAEKAARAEVRRRAMEERAAGTVEAGVTVLRGKPGVLVRDKPIVLSGYGPSIRHLMAMMVEHTLKLEKQPHVLWFRNQGHGALGDNCFSFGGEAWWGWGVSRRRLTELVAGSSATLTEPADLVIVEDLGKLAGERGASPWGQHGLVRTLQEVVDPMKPALVVGVASPSYVPFNADDAACRSMKEVAHVVTVRTLTDGDGLEPGMRRLDVGGLWHVDVPADALSSSIVKTA